MVRHGLRNVAAGANPDEPQAGHRAGRGRRGGLPGRPGPGHLPERGDFPGGLHLGRRQAIGNVIAEAIDKVGKDGGATVEESNTFGMELEFVEGMQFDKGFLSPYFVTDPERQEAILEEPYILFNQGKISSVQDLLPVLEKIMQTGKPLLIISEGRGGRALATLVVNKIRGTFNSVGVKAPGFGERRQGHAPRHGHPHRPAR